MTILTKKINTKQLLQPGSVSLRVEVKSFLSDTCTPVSLYLRLRDKFPGAVLLESSENAEGKNARSFIALDPFAEILVQNEEIKFKIPGGDITQEISGKDIPQLLHDFISLFAVDKELPAGAVTGLIGYTSYDAVKFFEDIQLQDRPAKQEFPVLRYALYKNIIVFDHLHHCLHIVSNLLPGEKEETGFLESVIRQTDVPRFSFSAIGNEEETRSDEDFLAHVNAAKKHCQRGDVFQIVLSRRFRQKFTGDEFNVYRSLRAINPSPYLFFADFGDYRIFGSSPEAQLVVQNNRAYVHPIAGTFRRTGDEKEDQLLEEKLLSDPKENAEHTMLVDLARNDLSRNASDVKVESYREVHRYSHVIHLVSKVSGQIKPGKNIFRLMADTFPAGTLSGAPKIKAMQLIDKYEPDSRSFYGGCIGLIGFDGSMNQAIMIRSFASKNGELIYQAGAGIVIDSVPEKELQEIHNKLGALRGAIKMASTLKN
jgi:anthranilate synthase component 1